MKLKSASLGVSALSAVIGAAAVAAIGASGAFASTAAYAPVHQWDFATAANGATVVADTGTGGSGAYAATVSLANVVNPTGSSGYLASTNAVGSGAYIPNSVFTDMTGSYTISAFAAISPNNGTGTGASDPTGDNYDALWGFGNSNTAWTAYYTSRGGYSDGGGNVQHDVNATPNDVNTLGGIGNGPMDLYTVTYNASTGLVTNYINGIQENTTTQTGFKLSDIASQLNSGVGSGIGFDPFSADGGTLGKIYELSMYNSAMSQSQVQAAYAAGPTGYVAPASTVTPSASPTPVHEWNFSSSTIANGSVSDVGSAASASTAGTLSGGATVSNGVLVTTGAANPSSGPTGMSIPQAALSSITGSFTLEDLATNESATQVYSTLFSIGNSKTNELLVHPIRGDSLLMSGEAGNYRVNYSAGMPAGKPTLVDMVYNASSDGLSFYVNGQLQGTATIKGGINLSQIVGTTNNGIGGFDQYGDPGFNGTTSFFKVYDSALTAGQILGNYEAIPTPEPASLAMLALGGVGVLMLARRKSRA
jgi:hypothetical protein